MIWNALHSKVYLTRAKGVGHYCLICVCLQKNFCSFFFLDLHVCNCITNFYLIELIKIELKLIKCMNSENVIRFKQYYSQVNGKAALLKNTVKIVIL